MRSCIFLLGVTCIFVFTQVNAQKGYIVKDSVYTEGNLFDNGIYRNNRRIAFAVSEQQKPTTYYPGKLVEFGFHKGDRYVSKLVPVRDTSAHYFLLVLVSGTTNLYLLETTDGDRYFCEVNNVLTELNSQSYRQQLKAILTNVDFSAQISSTRYNRKSLTHLINLYNSGYTGLLPRFRKGVILGVLNPGIETTDYYNEPVSIPGERSFWVGGFVDFPFTARPQWFINTQALYQVLSFSTSSVDRNNHDLDYLIQASSISVPISIKYSTAAKSVRFFAAAGPVFTLLFDRRYDLYQSIVDDVTQSVVITRYSSQLGPLQVGGTVSTGVEFTPVTRYSIGLGARYSKEFTLLFSTDQDHTVSGVAFFTYFCF